MKLHDDVFKRDVSQVQIGTKQHVEPLKSQGMIKEQPDLCDMTPTNFLGSPTEIKIHDYSPIVQFVADQKYKDSDGQHQPAMSFETLSTRHKTGMSEVQII